MFDFLNADNYTSLHYNPHTGEQNRLWIRYGDNTFEPVRRNGNVNRKSRNKPDAPDWWVTERPQGWNPRDHGYYVTLNHDYGRMRAANEGPVSPKKPDDPTQLVVPQTEQPKQPDQPVVPPTNKPSLPDKPLKPGEKPPNRSDRLFSSHWHY